MIFLWRVKSLSECLVTEKNRENEGKFRENVELKFMNEN